MTVKDIQQALLRKFNNHKYELCNSYVFNWECDFFSLTNNGYAYEVEIKLSRSDFFADFKKEKHKIFKLVANGKTWYWENRGPDKYSGEFLGRVQHKILRRRHSRMRDNLEPGIEYDWQTDSYIGNQWNNYYLEPRHIDLHAPCTRIRHIDLTKVNIPHRFFYACPAGMIKVNQVPDYAGLIYVHSASHEETVKPAPFIHKRPMDLKGILLEKFYYECRELRLKAAQL